MKAKSGSEPTVLEALKSLLEPSSQEAGCLRYELYQSTADASLFFTFEIWKDQSDLDAHMRAPYMAEAITGAIDHLVGGSFQSNPVEAIEQVSSSKECSPMVVVHADVPGADITHHHVTVNGVDLHCVEAGTAGSAVLLVHGFPETWWAFRGVIPRLAERHRVFAVDLRGFGDSSHDADTFDSATSAKDLQELIKHLGVGPVHLSAQDLSGEIAYRLAATSPGSVKSLTLIEAALPGFGGESLADVSKGGAWYIGALSSPGVADLMFAGREREFLADYLYPAYGAVPPAVTSEDVDEFVRSYSKPGGFVGAVGLYRSLLEDGDAIQRLAAGGRLGMPVMTIGSAAGEFTHTTATTASGRDDVRSVLLDGVGHYAALQAPDRVADALGEFFASIDSAEAS